MAEYDEQDHAQVPHYCHHIDLQEQKKKGAVQALANVIIPPRQTQLLQNYFQFPLFEDFCEIENTILVNNPMIIPDHICN